MATISIAPMLSVRNGAKAIDFYKVAFGAGELFRIDADSGAVVARLSVGQAEFWVADESPEHLNFSPESLGGCSVRMLLIVEDPAALCAQAIAAGATEVVPVAMPTDGASGALSTRSDTTGKSASRWPASVPYSTDPPPTARRALPEVRLFEP